MKKSSDYSERTHKPESKLSSDCKNQARKRMDFIQLKGRRKSHWGLQSRGGYARAKKSSYNYYYLDRLKQKILLHLQEAKQITAWFYKCHIWLIHKILFFNRKTGKLFLPTILISMRTVLELIIRRAYDVSKE